MLLMLELMQDAGGSDYAAACNNAAEVLYEQGSDINVCLESDRERRLGRSNLVHPSFISVLGSYERAVALFESAYKELITVGTTRRHLLRKDNCWCRCGTTRPPCNFLSFYCLDGEQPDLDSVDVPFEVAVTLKNLALALGRCKVPVCISAQFFFFEITLCPRCMYAGKCNRFTDAITCMFRAVKIAIAKFVPSLLLECLVTARTVC